MIQIACPNTGEICSDFFKRGKVDNGRQRYTCRKCGFTTVGERKERQRGYTSTKRGCCENERVVANGTYKTWESDVVRQRYKCTSCGKGFSHPLRYI